MSAESPVDNRGSFLRNLRSDIPSSVVTFLVALPLCMGIAIASGAPVVAGLITGIVGGLVVGMISGCPLQVSGPAAGLTVIVYDVIQRFGLEMLGLVVLLAGLMQMAAGLLRLGQWFRAVSPAVIKGMLAGIGFLILASQFHVMIDDKPRGSGAANLATIPAAIWKTLERPEFSDRQQREQRIAMLRDVGELHRMQLALQERISEYLASGRRPPDEAEVASAGPIPADIREVFADRQQTIGQRLESMIDPPGDDPRAAAGPPAGSEMLDAMAAASQRHRQALAALRQGAEDELLRSQRAAVEAFEGLRGDLKNHHFAAYAGIFTIVVILLWQWLAPRSLRFIPAPLLAVVLAAVLATVLALPVLYVQIPDDLWAEIQLPDFSMSGIPWPGLIQAALLMAVVASAETLLCATAVDQMQNGPRTQYDREMFGQGVGNTICGMLGALPMTGVIVRSSANVQAGARTRLSSILHGAWLLLFVAFLGAVLRWIPTSALAAMLVYTGYKLIDPKAIVSLRRFGWGEVAIYAATVFMIVFTDLLTGVLVGVTLSAIKLLYTFSHLSSHLDVRPDQRQATLSLTGSATFMRLPQLATQLEQVPRGAELQVDFKHLTYIDHACLDLLIGWAKQHESSGGSLRLNWDSLHARFHGDAGSAESVAGRKSPVTLPQRTSSTELTRR